MKASTFIQVALIDQMQQIADLGLWFHLTTLIAKGINTLAVVGFPDRDMEYTALSIMGAKYSFLPSVGDHWKSLSDGMAGPHVWLSHEPGDAEKHCTKSEDGGYNIHVPTFFDDYLTCANALLLQLKDRPELDIQMVSK